MLKRMLADGLVFKQGTNISPLHLSVTGVTDKAKTQRINNMVLTPAHVTGE